MKIIGELFEILMTRKPKISWVKRGQTEYALFNLANENMVIRFDLLDQKFFDLTSELKKLHDKKIISVLFGIDKKGEIQTQATGKSIAPKTVFATVKNIVSDYVKNNNVDIVIYAAKREDGNLESRTSLYNLIATVTARENSMSFIQFSEDKGTYFLLSKVKLTTRQQIEIKKEAIGKLSLFNKVKWIINK